MDNRTIEEIRKNETKLIDEIKQLERENQELKKQLEEKDDFINKLQGTKYRLDKYDYERTMQQKEFIEWLESNLEALEMCDRELILTNNKKEIKAYKEILSKYKEIIGVKYE